MHPGNYACISIFSYCKYNRFFSLQAQNTRNIASQYFLSKTEKNCRHDLADIPKINQVS